MCCPEAGSGAGEPRASAAGQLSDGRTRYRAAPPRRASASADQANHANDELAKAATTWSAVWVRSRAVRVRMRAPTGSRAGSRCGIATQRTLRATRWCDIPRDALASARPMLNGQLVHRSTTRWSPDVARRSRARPCGDVTAGEREPGGNPGLSRSGMQERPPSPGTEITEPEGSATREATASRSAIGSYPASAGPHGRCPRVRRPASRAGYAVSGGQRLVDWACGSPADVSGSSAGNITGMSPGSPPARMAMAFVLSNGETS